LRAFGNKKITFCDQAGEVPGGQAVTKKKGMSETQAVPLDADELPIVLPLKHAAIAPPLTFLCRRCGAVCPWGEPHGFDCPGATTERQRVMGEGTEAGKK
jgi:hypothetical protein